jgi:carbamoyltransferase
MTNARFDELFGGPPRKKGEPLTQRHMDVAASAQAVTSEVVLRLCDKLHKETGQKNLCMAGGVALNCVANGRVLREGPFERLWIQPAAGDAGGALGVAQSIACTVGGVPRRRDGTTDGMRGAYLGPSFDEGKIREVLDRYSATYHRLDDEELLPTVARALSEEKVVGWFQGRMEFGPRALGNRSILGDPRSANMQRVLNLKIKYRESFRPFAPAVLREDVAEYFDLDTESPYMLLVAPVREERWRSLSEEETELGGLDKLQAIRSDVPAITHVDHSARIQTVDRDTNPRFHRLLETFKSLTGCGVVVNTSFNVADEPIVCTPEEAYQCFLGTEMDLLVLENLLLYKEEQ